MAVLNDADAAGLAEVRYGAGRGVPGVVILLTFGTGVGSAVFVDGTLVPNVELGHMEFDGESPRPPRPPDWSRIEGWRSRSGPHG